MLILCSATLLGMGYVTISTSQQARLLNENTVDYAEYIMAKNSAHTSIQMAMQNINADTSWANDHDVSNPWTTTINDRAVSLYTEYIQHPDFWEPDSLRLIADAEYNDITIRVNSLYLKEAFSSLVPEFQGALQLPTDIGEFDLDGSAHGINGTPPVASMCEESKPPVIVQSEETKTKLEDEGVNTDGDIVVDPSINYEPTDELIERLYNSGNAIMVNGDYSDQLGTADNPGVFFIEEAVKLTGQQSEGYGIMVIRSDASLEYEGELSVAGNFEFNGLVIFENAFNFDGRGTPTINGSVLIGNTPDYEGDPIDIDLGGNIEINYDCLGEDYAKKAAANAVQQNKYTRIVSTQNINMNN